MKSKVGYFDVSCFNIAESVVSVNCAYFVLCLLIQITYMCTWCNSRIFKRKAHSKIVSKQSERNSSIIFYLITCESYNSFWMKSISVLSLSHNQFPCETGPGAGSISTTVKTGHLRILNNKCLNDLFRITCDYATVCVTEEHRENVFTEPDPPVSHLLCQNTLRVYKRGIFTCSVLVGCCTVKVNQQLCHWSRGFRCWAFSFCTCACRSFTPLSFLWDSAHYITQP